MIAFEAEGLGAKDVLLTIGATGALFIIATSLLDIGDHVVVTFPNYVTNIEIPRSIKLIISAWLSKSNLQ
jgi:aspartate/methionine/tyrosine aminotransferase